MVRDNLEGLEIIANKFEKSHSFAAAHALASTATIVTSQPFPLFLRPSYNSFLFTHFC
jgi:hypothetical protein